MSAQPTPETLHPWDRLPEESDSAFRAFRTYRDLGENRSLARVATELVEQGHVRGKKGTVRGNLSIWSSKHRWVERSAAWDRHLDRLDQVQQQRERREMRKRQAEIAQAAQMVLALPFRATLQRLQRNPDLLRELDQEALSNLIELSAQAARALPVVVQVERSARGEDEPAHEEWASDVSVDRASEEERLRRVALIMAEHNLLPAASPDIIVEQGPEAVSDGE